MVNIAHMHRIRRHLEAILLIPFLSLSQAPATGSSSLPEDSVQEPWHVSYVMRPSLEEGLVRITAVLVGEVGSGVVWRHADARMRRASQSRPEAQDGFGQSLRVAVHPQGWTITGGSGRGIQLTYEVTAPGPEPVGAGGVGIGSEAIYAPGYELFLIPDPALAAMPLTTGSEPARMVDVRADVIFDIPISWRIIVPWEGYGRRYNMNNITELWNGIVAAGDYRRQVIRAAGIDITVGIQGRRPSLDSTFGEIVRRVLLFGQQTFEVSPGDRMTVLLPRVVSGGETVIRMGHSVSFGWDSTLDIHGDVESLHQLSRELLLLWQDKPPEAPDWYAAGATDYLAWLLLLRENLIRRETFRQELLLTEQRYLAHPMAQEWSFAQEEARNAATEMGVVGSGRETGTSADIPRGPGDPSSLARSRGALVALTLDATIARLTGGRRRITDVMGLYYRWKSSAAGKVTVSRDSDLMAACAAVTGGDYLDDFFEVLVFSAGPPPTAESLADIMSRESGG